ncbi:Transmembrane prolyl 4-hydroxylase [Acropora cervicornis]|uniref:Transmembrane prolyl 4-hydroxylase n=1 Tax=Acropora cervicornis TaxID=6130 RepID=A0AAD9UVE0_ACRCE|nr:Transmembrane prolyl 4-hydroxylase [Acropora cervicornis]
MSCESVHRRMIPFNLDAIFVTVIFIFRAKCHLNTADHSSMEPCEDDTCFTLDGPCFIPREKGILKRLDGVKRMDLGEHGKYDLITRAMRPLLFEIPDFLSEDECDHIISLAGDHELFKSEAKGGLTATDSWKFDPKLGKPTDQKDCIRTGTSTPMETSPLRRFSDLNLPELDGDGVITSEEFQDLNTLLIDSYMYEIGRSHPRHRERFSEQTWLTQEHKDGVLQEIRLRVQALTKLPEEIIYGSEYLQVVRYDVDGHYHAHLDSETHDLLEVPCCHQTPTVGTDGTKCKLCRYITILYFLNEVDDGGETAFPMADNATLNKQILSTIRETQDLYNLSEYCHKSNLVFTPKKGTAILWYNHMMDPSGWLGESDPYSIHGGCAVKGGIKWIANNWITAPYKNRAHVPSQYVLRPDVQILED